MCVHIINMILYSVFQLLTNLQWILVSFWKQSHGYWTKPADINYPRILGSALIFKKRTFNNFVFHISGLLWRWRYGRSWSWAWRRYARTTFLIWTWRWTIILFPVWLTFPSLNTTTSSLHSTLYYQYNNNMQHSPSF